MTKDTKPYLPVGNYAFIFFDENDKSVGWGTTNMNRVEAMKHAKNLVESKAYASVKTILVVDDTKLDKWSKPV